MWKGKWSEFQYDLLVLIAKHVTSIDDFIRFGGVCKSWNRAAAKENFDWSSPQVPLLMLSADQDDDNRVFYSVSQQRICCKMFLPEIRGRYCLSTQQPGWLFTVKLSSSPTGEMTLFHPFKRTQIHLPSFGSLRGIVNLKNNEWEPEKAILSANPSLTSDYVLMISYFIPDKLIAFWRPGDLRWTSVQIENPSAYMDFHYFNGQFYILSRCCGLWVVDDLQGHKKLPPCVKSRLFVRINDRDVLYWDILHLVEASGKLFFVAQDKKIISNGKGWDYPDYYYHYQFQVWELDVITKESKNISIVGDTTIFLAQSASLFIDSSKFTGVKSKHIYFIDSTAVTMGCDEWDGIDMRIYSVEEDKIQSSCSAISVSPISLPIWVIPSF